MVRFIRKNASKFNIDPDRICAWGFSAGGDVISQGQFANPEDFDITYLGLPNLSKEGMSNLTIGQPMADPRPKYEAYNIRINGIIADSMNKRFFSKDDAACVSYTGNTVKHNAENMAQKANFERIVIRVTKKGLHNDGYIYMPGFNTPTLSRDGKSPSNVFNEASAYVLDWLKNKPKAVPPEARPNRRSFIGSTVVSLVPSSKNAKIYYTVDGSEPSLKSRLYTKPFFIFEKMLKLKLFL